MATTTLFVPYAIGYLIDFKQPYPPFDPRNTIAEDMAIYAAQVTEAIGKTYLAY